MLVVLTQLELESHLFYVWLSQDEYQTGKLKQGILVVLVVLAENDIEIIRIIGILVVLVVLAENDLEINQIIVGCCLEFSSRFNTTWRHLFYVSLSRDEHQTGKLKLLSLSRDKQQTGKQKHGIHLVSSITGILAENHLEIIQIIVGRCRVVIQAPPLKNSL